MAHLSVQNGHNKAWCHQPAQAVSEQGSSAPRAPLQELQDLGLAGCYLAHRALHGRAPVAKWQPLADVTATKGRM